MKRLIVDMDGVLADVYTLFLDWDERDTGVRKTPAEIVGKPETEAFAHAAEYVRTPGFFLKPPVMPESQQSLARLNREYEVFIVSSATEYPQSLCEKQSWLQTHFPFISWQQLVLCGSKKVVSGDIMLDDHFKNLDFFQGRTLLFTQPHNHNASNHRHERVDSWQQVMQVLL